MKIEESVHVAVNTKHGNTTHIVNEQLDVNLFVKHVTIERWKNDSCL